MRNIFKNISENKIIKSISIKDFASGRIFMKEFMIRQSKLILLIIVCVFVYMDNRMKCEQMLSKIDELNNELTTQRYIYTITASELLEAGQQSVIERLIKEKGLDLSNLNTPPYPVILK